MISFKMAVCVCVGGEYLHKARYLLQSLEMCRAAAAVLTTGSWMLSEIDQLNSSWILQSVILRLPSMSF